MGANGGEVANTVRDTIYRATLLLDDQKWDQWLELCDDSFHYAIKSFSPEINRDMIYLQGTRKELATMVKLLPKHNTDHGRLTRHATNYTVELDPSLNEAQATTSFACYRTMLDGINSHIDSGESQLFLIGKYYDRFRLGEDGPKFSERNVFLDTRRLDKGSHYPI